MSEHVSLEDVKEVFVTSPFWRFMGFQLLFIQRGEVQIKMEVRKEVLNVNSTVHGGVYASLLDTTMGMTARSLYNQSFVTLNLNIHYVKAISEGELRSRGILINSGRSIYTVSSEIYDGEGSLCAYGTGTFKVMKAKKSELPSVK